MLARFNWDVSTSEAIVKHSYVSKDNSTPWQTLQLSPFLRLRKRKSSATGNIHDGRGKSSRGTSIITPLRDAAHAPFPVQT